MTTGKRHIWGLVFADELNVVGGSLVDSKWAAKAMERSTDKVELKINIEKLKLTELLENE